MAGIAASGCGASATAPTAPAVSSFSPSNGPPGAVVTLAGSGFTGVTSVAFNGVSASFSVSATNEIKTVVPRHATNGPIAVASSAGAGKSAATFWVDSVTATGFGVSPLRDGTYHLQADEWNSTAQLTIASDGNPDLMITNSAINNVTTGGPGAYPSLYRGCHWGDCTTDSGFPMSVASVEVPRTVTTTYRTSTIASGVWDDSYDIWFNPNAVTADNRGGLELMIWLSHRGTVQPVGSDISSNVTIDGRTYDVWYGVTGNGGTLTFVLTNQTASVANLDLGPLAGFAVARGYMRSTWYLIDVEAGFEPWQGGQGLSVQSFAVCDANGC